jgi:hypothetical protein
VWLVPKHGSRQSRDDGAPVLQNGVATPIEMRCSLPARQRFMARRPDTRMDMARWCCCPFHQGWRVVMAMTLTVASLLW